MALPYTLANGPGNLPDATQLMANFNALVLQSGLLDITITVGGKGLVLTTPDGAHTYRIGISNAGELQTEQLT